MSENRVTTCVRLLDRNKPSTVLCDRHTAWALQRKSGVAWGLVREGPAHFGICDACATGQTFGKPAPAWEDLPPVLEVPV